MSRNDPSSQRLPEGGRRKLCWVGDRLCRLTVGADRSEIRVILEGHEPGSVDQRHARQLLALDDDYQVPLLPGDPLLALPEKVRNVRLGRVFWLYEAICQTVLHQRVSGAEAGLNWRRLCERHGEEWDGLYSAPSPRNMSRLSWAQLAACGIEQKRAAPLKEAAFRVRSQPDPEKSPDTYSERMLACRGIGPWTDAYVRGHFLGDPDAVPIGDYDLPRLVSYFFLGKRDGDDALMLKLLEPYRGHRYRVLRWLERSGSGPPRRGARLPLGTL